MAWLKNIYLHEKAEFVKLNDAVILEYRHLLILKTTCSLLIPVLDKICLFVAYTFLLSDFQCLQKILKI